MAVVLEEGDIIRSALDACDHAGLVVQLEAGRSHVMTDARALDAGGEIVGDPALVLNPTVYYRWQKEFFEGGAAAFAKEFNRQVSGLKRRLVESEKQLSRRNEVLAKVTEEYVRCKKRSGVR